MSNGWSGLAETTEQRIFQIVHPSDTAYVLMEVKHMAAGLGFNRVGQSMIGTAVSELVTNMVRYAGGGRILIQGISVDTQEGIRIIAEDEGPGIEDMEKALSETYSTGGSLGLGLPSVKRIMDRFFIESSPVKGTKVVVEKWIAK